MVVGVLLLCVLVLPFVELALFVQVSNAIGFWLATAILVACSLLGLFVIKREGISLMRRLRETLQQGEVPARDLLDGSLILAGGMLLLVPGFVTDVLGFLLLIPPTRALVRVLVMRRFERNFERTFGAPLASFGMYDAGVGGVGQARIYTGAATYDVMDVHEAQAPGDDAGSRDRGRPQVGPS